MKQAKPTLRGWYRNGSGFRYRQHRNDELSRLITVISCLALPLAYFVAYLLRSAQCSAYGISIELASVTVADFFSALFPLFLLLVPMGIVTKHIIRCGKAFFIIAGSISFIVVYAVYEGRHSLWTWAESLVPFLLIVLFVVLVAIDSVLDLKRDSSELKKPKLLKTLQKRALDALAFVCLGSLVCFYLDYDIPSLLLCLLASCFFTFLGNGGTISAIAQDSTFEKPIGKYSSRLSAIFVAFVLFSLIVFGLGYFSATIRIDYPLLSVSENEYDAMEEEGVQKWCVLMLRSDDIAICIPADKNDDGIYEANLAHDSYVRLIDTSSTPCVLVKDGCRLSRTT